MRVGRCAGWLAVVVALGAGWWLSPEVVPIYDGLSFPQDPYRYVASGTATAARATVALRDGTNGSGAVLNSAEHGPQVQLYLPAGALRGESVLASVEVTVTPTALTGSATPDQPASNVYRFAATVGLSAERAPIQVTLRAAVHKSPPVMYYRAGPTDSWERLRTRGLGHASFNATAPGFGDFVLVLVRGSGSGSPGDWRIFLVVGMLLLLSLVTSAVLTLRRRGMVTA